MDLNGLTTVEQREMLTKLLQQKAARAKLYPMSIGQQGLWHAFRRDPHSTSFNVFLPTRIRAAVDISAMRQAIEWVSARHVCLHTAFTDADGELNQIIKTGLLPDFQIIELPGGSDSAARDIIARECEQPFDLEQGPLLRVRVVRLAEDDCIILAMTHHIVVDFWSLVIILKELREAYPQFARQQPSQFPAAQNNYAQFVADQQTIIASSKGAKLREYWQSIAGQAAPVIELPTDRQRPAVFENRAASTLLEFPDSLVPQINSLAARFNATPFSVLHSALQVFLARYSQQHKFFIGSPFSGRSQQQYEQTVGFFINMLPLVADLEGDPSFAHLIKRTSRHLLDALEHEAYPIAQIVHDAKLPRDPSRSPLFQVSCTFEKAQVKSEAGRAAFLFPNQTQAWDFGGLRQESFYVPHPTCHYDLEFVFEQTDRSLRGMIVACRALFETDTVAAMARNFSSLLQSLVEHPDVSISQVPWQPEACENELTLTNNAVQESTVKPALAEPKFSAQTANKIDSSQSSTVCGMIARVADEQPHQIALQFADRKITFVELMKLANAIARQIPNSRDHQVANLRGSLPLIPVCSFSGPLAFIGMLGVQLAGDAPAAIDLTQPAIDATSLQRDTAAQLWLGHPKHPYFSKLNPQKCLDLESVFDEAALTDKAMHDVACTTTLPSPDDVAYVVYTSGSTGKPKGVLVDHGAICNTLSWRMQAVSLSSNDRVLMLLSHQFDAGLGIAWSTLTQAATLVWPDQETPLDPLAMIDQIIRDQITVLPAVPSLLRVLVSHPRFASCHSLRLIFTGGEAMPADLPRQLRHVTNARLWNFYGPSEAAVEATAVDVTDHSPARPVPIGRPIANTEILVLDPHQRPVPDTVPGELAIVGAGLARGYLNDPDLTGRKFVQLSQDARFQGRFVSAGTRMYLTGDRGRRMPNGQIEFYGRTDHQIKLRGYRIELGEIEAVLQSHPNVERAATKLIAPGTPEAQLIGYVCAHQSSVHQVLQLDTTLPHRAATTLHQAPLAAAIKQFAAQHLPHYKVPAAIVIVDNMPLTSSGKVDRAKLPNYVPSSISPTAFTPPTTVLEQFIAAAWCESLQVDSLSIDVNYFDAGGSSLGAAMLTSQLSQQLGIHVPTALLFDLADIGQVATRLAELHGPVLAARFGDDAINEQLTRARQMATAGPSKNDAPISHVSAMHPLLAPLKASGSRRPIFMVHPPGGIVICYRELARRLDPEQPLIAIRARGLHGQETMPQSLEAMAADYLEAVREVQPHGPYMLGGWSLGGLVAYEMAQQLLQSGESLAPLVLLDTTIPEGSTDLVPANELVNVGLEYGIDLTLDQLGQLSPAEQLPFLWEHAQGLGVIDDQSPPEVVARVLEELQHLFHHHVALAHAYRLAPLAANIDLFRPSETPFKIKVSPDRGWRHLVRAVTVHTIPGHHHSMVQSPNVEHLAQVINAWS